MEATERSGVGTEAPKKRCSSATCRQKRQRSSDEHNELRSLREALVAATNPMEGGQTYDQCAMLRGQLDVLALDDVHGVAGSLALDVEEDGRARGCALPERSIRPEALGPVSDTASVTWRDWQS